MTAEPVAAPNPEDPAGDQGVHACQSIHVAGGPYSLDGQITVDAHGGAAVEGPNIRAVHRSGDAHVKTDGAEQSPHPAISAASPSLRSPGGAHSIREDHPDADHQRFRVVAESSPGPTRADAITKDDSSDEAKPPPAAANAHAPTIAATPLLAGPILADPLLGLSAEILDDLEKVRIANENRLRQLTRDVADRDGEERGFGLDEDHPDVARLASLVRALQSADQDATKQLERTMRRHPLGAWVKHAGGVGEKQAARLLAAIRDPYWNDLHDRPRLVSELWTYCGYGDAVRQVRRRGGDPVNWSPDAKMRAHLIAAKTVQQLKATCTRPDGQAWADHIEGCACSRYRLVYDEGRRKYADSVHSRECVRCGPSGSPAQVGSVRSDGHQHAMAVRLVAKTLLRDLWREAKRLHEPPTP